MDLRFDKLPFGLDPLIAEAKRRARQRRGRLLLILLVLALGLGLAFAFGSSAGGGGTGGPTGGVPGTLQGVVSEVEHSVGDSSILSAKVRGRVLTVKLASSRPAVQAGEGFEAAILAYAVADWMRAHHRTPITNFYVVGPTGKTAGAGFAYPGDVIGSDATPTLRSGACEDPGTHLRKSLSVKVARTLPFAGGACILKVRTPEDPLEALGRASTVLSNAVPSRRDHAALIEIDNEYGTPQIVSTWFPGLGGHVGEGTSYCQPDLNCAVLHG